MIPINRFVDYPLAEALNLLEKTKDFGEIFEEVSKKLQEVEAAKFKVAKDTTLPNDIYINPKIIADYIKTRDSKLPLHIIIDKYDEWFDELYRLKVVNEPWLHHKPVFKHVGNILAVCYTWSMIRSQAIEGIEDLEK